MDWHRRITFAAVLALHIVLAALLLHSSRTILIGNDREIVSTLILLPQQWPPRPAPSRLSGQRVRTLLQKVEPVEIQSGSITLPGDAAPPINWITEAREVAAAQPEQLKAAATVKPAARATEISHTPAHVAGEQYNAQGEAIVWINRDCYLVSPPPEIGAPNALAHVAMTRTVCPGGSEAAPGELFKSLPAYEKRDRLNPLR